MCILEGSHFDFYFIKRKENFENSIFTSFFLSGITILRRVFCNVSPELKSALKFLLGFLSGKNRKSTFDIRVLNFFILQLGLPSKFRVPKIFLFWKWFRTEFWGFFSSENGSEWNCEIFSSKNGLKRNSKGFSLPRNGLERNFEGFSLPRNGLEWNSKGFSLPRNGSERNSEVFLFRKTGGVPMELPSVPSCYVFRIIIFFSENDNPICKHPMVGPSISIFNKPCTLVHISSWVRHGVVPYFSPDNSNNKRSQKEKEKKNLYS